VLVAAGALGVTIAFNLRDNSLQHVLGGCAVLLLAGSATGVFGTDFDRERKFAHVGIFLNLALLVPVGLLWLATMLVT
jgi:hypothetical protein